MNLFYKSLLTCLLGGFGFAWVAIAWGWTRNKIWLRALTFLAGVVGLWIALLGGLALGYRRWQATPDPQQEAFADGGPMMSALLFGWIPACVLCGVIVFVMGLRATPLPKDESS